MGFDVIVNNVKQDEESLLGPGSRWVNWLLLQFVIIISPISVEFSRRMSDEVMSKTSHHYNFSPSEENL